MKTKIITITSGRGPAECCWVAAQVLKLICEECKTHRITATIIHRENGQENRTIQSASLSLEGENLIQFVTEWIGTILWIGTSPYRKHHKRKNWYVGVYERNDIEQLELNEKDLRIQTMRSGGAGGQHVNKVSTAVRITHTLTGISVTASDRRSQLQNKKIALERLKERIANYNLSKISAGAQNDWSKKIELERGNPIKTIKGSDFKTQITKQKSFKKRRNILKNELKKEKSEEQ